MVVNLITLFLQGFVFLFVTLETVGKWTRIAFHVFGVMMAILGIVTFAAVYGAASCKGTTTQLYNLTYGLSVISLVAIGYRLIHRKPC